MSKRLLAFLTVVIVGDLAQDRRLAADVLGFYNEVGIGGNPFGLYAFDTSTGVTSFLAPRSSTTPRAVDFSHRPSDGQLFAADASSLGSNLYQVNPNTATFTAVGGPAGLLYQSISFHPVTGVLYGNTFSSSSNPEFLVTINPANGQVLMTLGTLSQKRLKVGFDPSGNLFGLVGNNAGGGAPGSFHSINLTTAATTLMNSNTSLVGGSTQDLTYSNGFFYSIDFNNSKVYRFNPSTGVGNHIGTVPATNNFGLFAIVPEASAWRLLALVGLAIAVRQYAQRRFCAAA